MPETPVSRYHYKILDKNRKEILFKENAKFQIIIDTCKYMAPNIPQEAIGNLNYSPYDHKNIYKHQICINDLSMLFVRKPTNTETNQLEIKIIYNNDTMHICQASGLVGRKREQQSKQTKLSAMEADLVLEFMPGYYYFPEWAKDLLKNLPQTSGNVQITNIYQSHFLISRELYQSLLPMQDFNNSRKLADKQVEDRFVKDFLIVESKVDSTQFVNSMDPYKSPYWVDKQRQSRDPNRFYGMMGYSMNQGNCHSGVNFFAVLHSKENKIEHFMPLENPRRFTCTNLYIDAFNELLYLPVLIRQEFDYQISDCYYNMPFEKRIYCSGNEGKNWKVDERATELFEKYNLEKIEFLDKDYALGYTKRKLNQKVHSADIIQGTYYLLKNMRVIDSLKSPKDLYYNSNYNNYGAIIKQDSVLLGRWTYDPHYTVGKTRYFQPLLLKTNHSWQFKVEEKTYQGYEPVAPKAINPKTYQNFQLVNGRELVFSNGAGSLSLDMDLTEEPSNNGYFAIEQGRHIYLLKGGALGALYISFNGGYSWLLYPLPLDAGGSYHFLDIDEQGVISHFTVVWSDQGRTILKRSHRFMPR